jgi:predicted amidophosphoribosyltransferase
MGLSVESLSVNQATHYLRCSHCIGPNEKHYVMRSVVLKDMGDGRVKLLVFGERNWAGRDHIKKIRYVPKTRIRRIAAPE